MGKLLNQSERRKCDRNYLFSDGMHTCPETLASRYGAGIACLLGCVYNGNDEDNARRSREVNFTEHQRACERDCNDQFNSVVPVDEALINTDTSLASFSL